MLLEDLDSLLKESSQAFRSDVGYAETILASARTLQLKRNAWAAKRESQPQMNKPAKPSKMAVYNVDDLLAELEATG